VSSLQASEKKINYPNFVSTNYI